RTFLDNGPVQGLADGLDSGLQFWRDLHLLRPALTMRTVGMGQLEMAGTGAASLTSHPLQAIATVIGANPEGRLYQALKNKGIEGQIATSITGAPFTSYDDI